jgi:exonuclease SbcD
MKFIHTADWHLGKLVQGVYMTEDQRFVLNQLIEVIEQEKPDAVVIAGDLYDRAIPPTEAVDLLNSVLERIVIGLRTPVLAISGNHDSPDRIEFGTKMMEAQGLHLVGQLKKEHRPVILNDEYGEVHFHLIPFADPSQARFLLEDESVRTHDDAMKAITTGIQSTMDPNARHIFVGHAFITPSGEREDNTSESERTLSIGGAEYVSAEYYAPFHYTALGHLHQDHYVKRENIRYAGSPLKYSISEEHHRKGFSMIHIDGKGNVEIERRLLEPLHDLRTIEATIEEIMMHPRCEDYVFVSLLNENPVLFPMEKVRSTYPNAMHVERKLANRDSHDPISQTQGQSRNQMDPTALFAAFYQEVRGSVLTEEKKRLFAEIYDVVLQEEGNSV